MIIECFNTPSIHLDLDLNYCGYADVSQTFHTLPHIRDCYLVHYIIKGEMIFETAGHKHPVVGGQAFAIFPGDLVSYYTCEAFPWSFCWFAFNGKRAPELLEKSGITRSAPVTTIHNENNISQLVNGMIEQLQARHIQKTCVQGYLYLLLGTLERACLLSGQAPSRQKNVSHYVQTAIQYIEYNYMNEISVRHLSDFVGLERTYFSKIFHKTTGVSPQNYIRSYRVEKAIRLLQTTNLLINEICYFVGISDPYYFSKMFRKIRGFSPSEFRGISEEETTNLLTRGEYQVDGKQLKEQFDNNGFVLLEGFFSTTA